jgi:hypothetical protein
LLRYYGRVARSLLHDPDVREQLRALGEDKTGSLQASLQAARAAASKGPPRSVPGAARKAIEEIRTALGLPSDWDLFIWCAAVYDGERSRYPICPSLFMASLADGPDKGFFIGVSAQQMAWWNSGALVYAVTGFKRMLGSPTKPGRQPDYERAVKLAEEYDRLGSWEEVYRQQDSAEGDPTAIRRQVDRFRRRGYR